ncbi:hypothetical protein [Mycobacteroides abscessus]|uniref:hypothetical protein n=1 Tax=Mycobacteroides abscessus TaxID=36809 RepID=UPI0018784030
MNRYRDSQPARGIFAVDGKDIMMISALPYSALYSAARDLGYTELEAMRYASEPDLFAADHPDDIVVLLDPAGEEGRRR